METPSKDAADPSEGAKQTTVTSQPSDDIFKSREDYFAALQKWINDAQMWQNSMACMPYMFLMPPGPGLSGLPGSPWVGSVPPTASNRVPTSSFAGVRFKVPPYWKRFCAEVVDSIITFVLKLFITFLAIHVFGLIDPDKYSLELLQQNVQSLTYKVAIEMTSQLLFLELVNRVVVCLLEAYWLRGGEDGRIGGSTPGKNLFGLRVVLCYQANPIPGQPNEVVSVTPGTDLGWRWSLTRALSKNIFLALIYPLCFAFFFFKFNRLGYDILSHSIVVECVDHNNNRR